MRAGHIVYAVSNLEKAIKEWQDKGFKVEYARKSKKINALIYFSKGPFIELIEKDSISKMAMRIFLLFGGKPLIERMKNEEIVDTDRALFCIEKDYGPLDKEIAILAEYDKKGLHLKNSRRKDPYNRILKWRLFIPEDLSLPFLMSYYNIDPKPESFVHPNNVVSVKGLKLVTNKNSIEILEKLIDDESIKLVEGNANAEVIDIEFEYNN